MSVIHDEQRKQKEMKNKVKEREKRIKQIKENQYDTFELDTETVIRMTNKNNAEVQNRNRKINENEQKRIKKRKKRMKKILKWTSLIILILGAIIFALVSPIFNIKEIEVANTNILSQDTIVSLSGLKKDNNIFRFLKSDVEKSIKENPYVESVNIKRQLPNKVLIEVEERQRNFNLEFLNGFAYINNQGYILEISEEKLDLPILKGAKTPEEEIKPGNRLCMEDLQKLESAIKIMNVAKENEFDSRVTSIDISNKNEYILYLEQDKKTVYLGDINNLNTKMLYVKKMIDLEDKKEGTIFVNGDFNNKFKAYFREKV